MRREDVDFRSGGTRCACWLYGSRDASGVVIMAHGFGGERRHRLPAFAERFVDRGLAVLVFDYRGFGDSDGEPRRVIDPSKQVEDWLAAVRRAESLGFNSIALWGTSFSGGHVVATAAKSEVGISAVVSQVPFADGRANTVDTLRREGAGYAAHALTSALRDTARRLTLRGPSYVPVVGETNDFAVINTPDAKEGYESVAGDGPWDNRCAARVLFSVFRYRPVEYAPSVDAPTFVVSAGDDDVVPQRSVEALIDSLPNAETLHLPVGHFDVYTGETFHRVAEAEADFLEENL